VLGSAEVLEAALARHASRLSGLAARLQGGEGNAVADAVVTAPVQGQLF